MDMLVLSRKVDERIKIGDDIVICISKIHSNRVSIAIEAPKELKILRSEIERPKMLPEQSNKMNTRTTCPS